MKAAVFHGPNRPLEIEEVPKPEPGAGDVVIRVAACGVCHTDLHYIDHGVPTFKEPPLILGHEASGIVAETGDGVEGWKEGDRVLIPAVLTCGHCPACRSGRENICRSMTMLGNNIDGAYAEFIRVPAKDLVALPDDVPIVEGSIIADAVSTPFHAVKNRARVEPGETVVVFGCGGVGINVVQIAAAVGGLVIAVDIDESKLERARALGAVETIHAGEVERVSKAVRKLTGGEGADVAIEVIGKAATMEEAFNCIRTGGRLCIVGYTNEKISVNAGRIMYREVAIIGSLGCRPVDYPAIVELVRNGRLEITSLVSHRFPLEEIHEAFDVMRKGGSLRSVVVF
jgi:6-hydroxycyclohex-1-ene-1-carbonyl-CoA dehydrogenase